MGKPTTNWPSDSAITFRPEDGREARMSLEEMAAEGLVVPTNKFPRDGGWHPENAALQQAAGASSALGDFYREQQEIEIEIRRYERRYQETGESFTWDDAVALARRIMGLYLSPTFDGREDFIKFLAGKCLTLKEGQAAGEVYAVVARLEAVNIPQWRGNRWSVTLAIPAELQVAVPDPTFGVQTFRWLRQCCESLVRELAIRGFPHGGDFAIVGGLTRPGPDAVPVVPAPIEAAIAEYVEHAASCPDHWDALAYAVEVLCKCRQPLGDALGTWTVEALRGERKRPDARKAAKAPANALRNQAIIEAVRALERCGMKATRNTKFTRANSACDAVAAATNGRVTYEAAVSAWKNRDRSRA